MASCSACGAAEVERLELLGRVNVLDDDLPAGPAQQDRLQRSPFAVDPAGPEAAHLFGMAGVRGDQPAPP